MRIAAFIDGPNVYAAAKGIGMDMDYKKLRSWLDQQGQCVRAFYYTAVTDGDDFMPMKPLIDWLAYNGYAMVTKSAKEFTDGRGNRKVKGNMDIELAVDMLELAAHVDHIYLFSGDGDFRKLIEAVQRKGVRVTVVSTLQSAPPMIADDLRRQADTFLDLHDLQFLQRDVPPRAAKAA